MIEFGLIRLRDDDLAVHLKEHINVLVEIVESLYSRLSTDDQCEIARYIMDSSDIQTIREARRKAWLESFSVTLISPDNSWPRWI